MLLLPLATRPIGHFLCSCSSSLLSKWLPLASVCWCSLCVFVSLRESPPWWLQWRPRQCAAAVAAVCGYDGGGILMAALPIRGRPLAFAGQSSGERVQKRAPPSDFSWPTTALPESAAVAAQVCPACLCCSVLRERVALALKSRPASAAAAAVGAAPLARSLSFRATCPGLPPDFPRVRAATEKQNHNIAHTSLHANPFSIKTSSKPPRRVNSRLGADRSMILKSHKSPWSSSLPPPPSPLE